MHRLSTLSIAAVALLLGTALESRAALDPAALCHKTIVGQLLKFKRSHLGNHVRCLERENKYSVPASCPDARATDGIQRTRDLVEAQIASKCTMANLATLGFPTDCAYQPAANGIEADCAALPVTTPAEFAQCLMCWKGAELAEYVALLYASHAIEICGGSLDDTSPVCSALDCTTPLPDQLDLGNSGQNMCQRFIGNAGVRYMVNRERTLERCLLAGGTQASCLADPSVQGGLSRLSAMTETTITNQCGADRVPDPTLGFCCHCGTAMSAMCTTAPADRAACLAIDPSCSVQEGRSCNMGTGNCDAGPKEITWWAHCPENDTCPGPTLGTIGDLIDCVTASADTIVDELLCLQFPGYPCPPD